MLHEILCAGFGGQGIMYMGKILTQAAMESGFYVTWSSSYGIEVRGGTAHCIIKISQAPIALPLLSRPTFFIAMNELSFLKFRDKIAQGGTILFNSSLIAEQKVARPDIRIIPMALNELAQGCGDRRIANMVALGAYSACNKGVSLQALEQAMEAMTSLRRRNLLEMNKKALSAGYEAIFKGESLERSQGGILP